jgi:hypothetical protein
MGMMKMIRNEFFEHLFGKFFEHLIKDYKFSPMIICALLIWIMVYFVIKIRHVKGEKYSIKEKIYLGLAIWCTLLALISQIAISTGHW